IEGDFNGDGFKGAIEIESFSWGVTNSGAHGSGGGGGAGKANFQDLHFVCKTGKASPLLFLACAKGTHIQKATLFVRRSNVDRSMIFIKMDMVDNMVQRIKLPPRRILERTCAPLSRRPA